jgi:glycosyltransferase involved in cell wall biosynthesis
MLVSIVINNYNYGRFLHAAIDSALLQTYPDVEIVVVDDGSTDGSPEILEEYGCRIKPVFKANGGQASAINTGFARCTGDVVIFLDSDDELYPSAAEQVAAAFNPATAKVHGVLDEIDADGRLLGRTNPSGTAALAAGDVLPSLLRTGRYISPVMSGNAYPRWVLERILPIPEESFPSGADTYMVAVAPLHGPVARTPAPVGKYRRHGGNVWAGQASSAAFSTQLRRELARYDALRKQAADLGLRASDRIDLDDLSGLRIRLVSRRFAGENHPLPHDRRRVLVTAGVRALWRANQISLSRRLLFMLWLVIVGFGPLPLARRAVTWLYSPSSRPGASSVSRSRRRQM